ncbi:hypothetical protein ACFQDD_00520 [Halorubrum pallidum]|uniref:Uncharacterized protein n=1 Tax=Halorubrum pallidum TaxID=1526114 RepID=A0ABD5T3T9_9EURY
MNLTNLPDLPSGWIFANQNEQAQLVTILSDDNEYLINLSVTPFTAGDSWVVTGLRGWDDHPLFAKNVSLAEAFETAVELINDVEAGRDVDPITEDYQPGPSGKTANTEPDTDNSAPTDETPEAETGDDNPTQAGLDQWA